MDTDLDQIPQSREAGQSPVYVNVLFGFTIISECFFEVMPYNLTNLLMYNLSDQLCTILVFLPALVQVE